MTPGDNPLPQITDLASDTVELNTLPPSPLQAERVSVEAQLLLFQTTLDREQVARQQHVAKANRQLTRIRRELQSAADARVRRRTIWRNLARVSGLIGVFVILVSLKPLLSAHPISRAVLNTVMNQAWTESSRRVRAVEAVAESVKPQPSGGAGGDDNAEVQKAREPEPAPAPTPAPPSLPFEGAGAQETYELQRLNGALMAVPAAEVPEVLNAVNKWLWAHNGVPCWVLTPANGVSLVIASGGPGQPLLTALSRCADAVEHVTGGRVSNR